MSHPPLMPVDAVMPALTQSVLIAVFGVMVLASFVHALLLIRRDGDHRLMVMLGCGAAAALLEGFACHLIRCYHSPHGMVQVYEAFQIHVPLWLAELYVLFFGAMPYYFLRNFARTPTAVFFWRSFIGIGIAEGIGEMVTIHLGTHVYYGVQPLQIFGFPAYLGFLNPACAMAVALIAAYWFDAVRGARRYLLIVLTPPLVAAVYSGLSFPTIAFIHEGAATAMVLGSIATMLLCVLLAGFVLRSLPRFVAQYR